MSVDNQKVNPKLEREVNDLILEYLLSHATDALLQDLYRSLQEPVLTPQVPRTDHLELVGCECTLL